MESQSSNPQILKFSNPQSESPSRLISADGDVRVGIFAAPIDEVNYRDFDLRNPFGRRVGALGRHFGFKQFQFLGALSETVVFGCAIAALKYVNTAFVYVYEPATRRFHEASFRMPLSLGVHCDQRPETGSASFHSRGNHIVMSAYGLSDLAARSDQPCPEPRPRREWTIEETPPQRPNGERAIEETPAAGPPAAGPLAAGPLAAGRRRLEVRLADGLAIDATFDETAPPSEPMCICTPAGATGWVYARKTAGHTVAGTLHWDGRSLDLATIGARGHHDWSAGYMRRHTFWNWGCLAGVVDGRVLGMNVSCGVNETSVTENCFWVDGRLHKLDTVSFEYNRRDLMQPWRLRSYDGRLRLDFIPEGKHAESINAWIVASNFNQLCGRFTGRLETTDGERIEVSNLLGYMERHYAKW
jgi:hypothetical protein